MRFRVLAVDYDGTIASDGIIDPSVRAGLEAARSKGVTVVLVTGRILRDLRRLMGDLSLFDAIVAENGAVVAFPGTGRSAALAAPPSPSFLKKLEQLGIEIAFGESIVEADAHSANEILSVIRQLEMPLVILFNRGRLMVLPQAISKATGLRAALSQLRRSLHNAIAIGDGENDHELLAACEVGMAVGWGSDLLKSTADGVIKGQYPKSIADFLDELAKQVKLPSYGLRHNLILGTSDDRRPVSLPATGRKVLIAGDPQTGKSWIAGGICEKLIQQRYSVCVIDPEGDYSTMETLPGVILLGGDDPPPRVRDLSRAIRNPEVSIVVGLSKLRPREKREYVSSLLMMLAALRREVGLPHHIVIDEAHYFLGGDDVIRLLDFELSSYTLITYRASVIHPSILASLDSIIVTRLTDEEEVRSLRVLRDGGRESEGEWESLLGNLALEEAVLLPSANDPNGVLAKFCPTPRVTAHVRHLNKYLDIPLPEHESFVFTKDGVPIGRKARTIKEFVAILSDTPAEILDDHLRKGDFSQWIESVFRDCALAGQIREMEGSYRLGYIPDINDALILAVQTRYSEP